MLLRIVATQGLVDQWDLNLRAGIIIEALALIDWSSEGQLKYERSVNRNFTCHDKDLKTPYEHK